MGNGLTATTIAQETESQQLTNMSRDRQTALDLDESSTELFYCSECGGEPRYGTLKSIREHARLDHFPGLQDGTQWRAFLSRVMNTR